MKKAYLFLAIPLMMAACSQPTKTETPTATETPDYPYKIDKPDQWLMDTSHANTMTALKIIKAFETSDTTSLKAGCADSITFNYDGGKFKGPTTTFAKMAVEMAATMKGLKIKMNDWEGVVSKDGKEEWVTLWYTQSWTDAKGVADSVELVNDMQFKSGKMIRLNEYNRHFKLPTK